MLTRGREARFNAYAMRLIKLDYLCHHNRSNSRKTLPDLLWRVFYPTARAKGIWRNSSGEPLRRSLLQPVSAHTLIVLKTTDFLYHANSPKQGYTPISHPCLGQSYGWLRPLRRMRSHLP